MMVELQPEIVTYVVQPVVRQPESAARALRRAGKGSGSSNDLPRGSRDARRFADEEKRKGLCANRCYGSGLCKTEASTLMSLSAGADSFGIG